MIYFPNAKINLGLRVVEKRADGFHNIETVFYPIDLSDVLEILPHLSLEFKLSGLVVDGNPTDNLCMKAYHLLRCDYNLPPVYMQLHKIIPMGAGLGGGSADAAFVLKALNNEFSLGLSDKQLMEYAARLGSDCAFFIENKPTLATGRGEILEPVDICLKGYHLLLVKPDIHVGTAEAYAGISPQKPATSLADIVKQPVSEWKQHLINDFEATIFKRYPGIASIKKELYEMGAAYAAMSGSGSTVYALFTDKPDIGTSFKNCFVHTDMLIY